MHLFGSIAFFAFLFLLFGEERAVLLDTGATASPEFFPLRRVTGAIPP